MLVYFLTALGVSHTDIPNSVEAQATLYRTLMTGRRMLVILDNARDAEQVRPLIPAAPGCFVIVTSRNRLIGLVAQEGAHQLTLNPPTIEEARAVLRMRLGVNRDDNDLMALDEIIERCGRLPLAMAVVAARAIAYPERRLSDIVAELRDSESLDAFNGDEERSDVRTVFSWSYRMLSKPAARLFRLLALHPGPDFGLSTVASLAGVRRDEVKVLITELTRTRLLTEHQYHRYVFHDLIRLYAIELSKKIDAPEDRAGALSRVMDHLQQTAHMARSRLLPQAPQPAPSVRAGVTPERPADVNEAMAWFTEELGALEAAIAEGPAVDFPVWRIAESLLPYYQRRGMYRPWETAACRALQAARHADDKDGQARMHRMIAGAKHFTGRSTSAISHLQRALMLFSEQGNSLEQANVFRNLGWISSDDGHTDQSRRYYQKALVLFENEGDERGVALALLGIGRCLVRANKELEATQQLRRAAAIFDQLGDYSCVGNCATVMSEAFEGLGQLDQAIEWRRRAQRLFHQTRNEMETADNERALGNALMRAGRTIEAVQAWQEAKRVYTTLGSESNVEMLTTQIRGKELSTR